MRSSGFLAILCLSLASAGWAERPSPIISRPVMVGGLDNVDACPTVMRVTFQKPKAGNFAVVRLSPDINARIRGQIPVEYLVMACETEGDWTGIVYHPIVNRDRKRIADCGVSNAIPIRRPYRGRCVSGWVATRLLKGVAG